MRRRTVLKTASLALAATLLVGCAADTADTASPATETTYNMDGTEPDPTEPAPAEPMLPDPTGPVYQVTTDQYDYPFELQGIGTSTGPQVFGEPAPAGRTYYVIAVRFRPTLTDRATVPPSAYLMKVSGRIWSAGARSATGTRTPVMGSYWSSSATTFRWMPVLSTLPGRSARETRWHRAPGTEYNVVFKALVPDDADLSQARMRWVYGDGALPVGSLPELPWS